MYKDGSLVRSKIELGVIKKFNVPYYNVTLQEQILHPYVRTFHRMLRSKRNVRKRYTVRR